MRPSSLRVFIDHHPAIHGVVIRWLRWRAKRSPCPFCDIVQGHAPGRLVYKDDLVTAFWDAHPSTSTHILVVPNRHIPSLNDLTPSDEALCGHMLLVARQLAREQQLLAGGYSLTTNTGLHAGQTVFHLHIHLKNGGN